MTDKNNEAAAGVKAQKKLRLAKTTKIGTYTFIISLIVLAVIIVINLLVGAIPSRFTVFDTSANKLYTISDSTESYLGGLAENVTINWICQGGETDDTMKTFIDRYAACSPKLKVKILDPVKNPAILTPYLTETDTQPSNFSFIIESGRRYKIVDFNELFYFNNEFLNESYGLGAVPYEAYEYYYQYFAYAEGQGYVTDQLFYGDDTITKAVEYVTLENIPHIYILEGHGEDAFTVTLLDFISANNVVYETLRLSDSGSVPVDANCVVIYSPKNDISTDEASVLRAYLQDGGNMMLVTSPDDTSHSNLLGLMADYGLSAAEGTVYEGNTSYYKDNAYNLKPTVNSAATAVIPSSAASYTMYMPLSHGITIGDDNGGATVTELFTTSDSAYSIKNEVKSEPTQYALGVSVSKQTDNGVTQLVWYSSADAFTDSAAQSASYGNYYFMFYSLFWMNETYESKLSTVEGPSLGEPILDGLTTTSIYVWTFVFVILIPGIVIVTGLVVWIRRRKR